MKKRLFRRGELLNERQQARAVGFATLVGIFVGMAFNGYGILARFLPFLPSFGWLTLGLSFGLAHGLVFRWIFGLAFGLFCSFEALLGMSFGFAISSELITMSDLLPSLYLWLISYSSAILGNIVVYTGLKRFVRAIRAHLLGF